MKEQLAQIVWAGELEGWLTAPPQWHLVADGATAGEWETLLRDGLGEPVEVTHAVAVAGTGRAHGPARGDGQSGRSLLPAEYHDALSPAVC